jgi:hypothetical protein
MLPIIKTLMQVEQQQQQHQQKNTKKNMIFNLNSDNKMKSSEKNENVYVTRESITLNNKK